VSKRLSNFPLIVLKGSLTSFHRFVSSLPETLDEIKDMASSRS
jgi:hypothetical protein